MFKKIVMTSIIGLGVVWAATASATNYHPTSSATTEYYYPLSSSSPDSNATVSIHILPDQPIIHPYPVRPPRPVHPIRPVHPPRVCVSVRPVGTLIGKMAKNIHAGRRAHQLTRRELMQLNNQQNRIIRKKTDMLKDHCLTKREERQLMRMIQQAQRDIHKARTNHDRCDCHRHH